MEQWHLLLSFLWMGICSGQQVTVAAQWRLAFWMTAHTFSPPLTSLTLIPEAMQAALESGYSELMGKE